MYYVIDLLAHKVCKTATEATPYKPVKGIEVCRLDVRKCLSIIWKKNIE